MESLFRGISGLSQSDILRVYLELPKTSPHDTLKRNENTFYKEVWPMLEHMRKQDKGIQTFERLQFGKEIPIWQLK